MKAVALAKLNFPTISIQVLLIQMYSLKFTQAALRANMRWAAASEEPYEALDRLHRALEKAPREPDVHMAYTFLFSANPRESIQKFLQRLDDEAWSYPAMTNIMIDPAELVPRATQLLAAATGYYIHSAVPIRSAHQEIVSAIATCHSQLHNAGEDQIIIENAPSLLPAIEEVIGIVCGTTLFSEQLRQTIRILDQCEVQLSPKIRAFYDAWPRDFLKVYPEWLNVPEP